MVISVGRPKRSQRAAQRAGAALAALAIAVTSHAYGSPTFATETVDVPRTSGVDPFATCAAVSAAAFTATNEVVIASGDEYPDGLSAAAFAGEVDAPVLLVPTIGTLPAAVTAEITRLGATTGHIMGGTAAVSADMESQLKAAGVTTMTRYPGVDRYDTSRLVAQALSTIGTDNGKTTAFVTTGETRQMGGCSRCQRSRFLSQNSGRAHHRHDTR